MRLISQDGCADIPYEQFTIMLDANANYRVILAVSDKMEIAMASYSTSAKALDALKQMREAYLDVAIITNDMDEETISKLADMVKSHQSFVLTGNDDTRIENIATYFKFPQDGDVFDENDILS